MISKFTYGYLKEAVKAHLDLEEDELEVMNINQRFHIFANEAIQQICYTRPKYTYFEFTAVDEFAPLVYINGVLRVATAAELLNTTLEFATDEETADWYNKQNIYLVGQVVTMPDNFLSFAAKQAFVWTDFITNKVPAPKAYIVYLSNSEFIVQVAANYLIPYRASWVTFVQDEEQDSIVTMPADLLLTIPIYVASVILQQRNLNMAQAKRQEFEIAVSRSRSTNFLATNKVMSSFE